MNKLDLVGFAGELNIRRLRQIIELCRSNLSHLINCALTETEKGMVLDGEVIDACRSIRERTGLRLPECKKLVDGYLWSTRRQ